MDYALTTKLAAEFVGTAILMIFGNGAVANVELKGTKGFHSGWLTIAMGYGFGVMFPVLMFGGVSGAHINPAMTIAQAVNGMFPWSQVAPFIAVQLLGAAVGQLLVFAAYYPHYMQTESSSAILASFTTTDASESKPTTSSTSSSAPSSSCSAPCAAGRPVGRERQGRSRYRRRFHRLGPGHFPGRSDRPWPEPRARPDAPHSSPVPPIPGKGTSRWDEAWIPVVAPILGAIVGAFIFKTCFGA